VVKAVRVPTFKGYHMDTELKESFKKEIEILESEGFKYHGSVVEEDGYIMHRFIDSACRCVEFNTPDENNIVYWGIGCMLFNGTLNIDQSGCDDKSYFHKVVEEWFDL